MTAHGFSVARCVAWAMAVCLAGLPWFAAAQAGSASSTRATQLACAPDRPVVHPGEAVGVRAWASDGGGRAVAPEPSILWWTDSGQIAGGNAAQWTVPADVVVPGSARSYRAVATVNDGAAVAECEIQVYVVPPRLPNDSRGPMGGRGLLVGQAAEPKGYGLLSYLLLRRPAQTETERQRHLNAVAAVLSGRLSVDDLLEVDGVTAQQLYIVLLPVKRRVEMPDNPTAANLAQTAERVLEVYNYARAAFLLSTSDVDGVGSGPYMAIRTALQPPQAMRQPWDMSHVDQRLVRDWVNAYCRLAAQPRSWTELALAKLSLNTRNAIAVAAQNLPDVLNNLDRWMPTGAAR